MTRLPKATTAAVTRETPSSQDAGTPRLTISPSAATSSTMPISRGMTRVYLSDCHDRGHGACLQLCHTFPTLDSRGRTAIPLTTGGTKGVRVRLRCSRARRYASLISAMRTAASFRDSGVRRPRSGCHSRAKALWRCFSSLRWHVLLRPNAAKARPTVGSSSRSPSHKTPNTRDQLRSGAPVRLAGGGTGRHLSLQYGCRPELRQLHRVVRQLLRSPRAPWPGVAGPYAAQQTRYAGRDGNGTASPE